MTSRQLTDLALRHQIFLEGLKLNTTQTFNKSYEQITAKSRELLAALEVTNLQDASRSQVEDTIRQLEVASVTYGHGAIDELALEMTDYAEYAAEYEAASLGSMLKSKTPRAVGAAVVMERVFDQPVPLGNGEATLLSGMYAKLTNNEAARLGNSIRNSYLRNDTVMEATRAIVGSKAMNYSDGVLAISRRNAAAVVHTSMQHVHTSARFQTYEENDDLVIGYEWISTLDSATTTQCQALDGSKFLFKKGGYQPRPPIHVRCRSTTGPILDDGLDFLDEGATRSSREGYTSAKDTYYDWLRRQTPEEQRKILGAKRYDLFTKGGMTDDQFRKLNLDKNFQPTTLAEMKAAKPAVFAKVEKERGKPLFSAPISAAPKPGTTTAKVWNIADELEKELGRIPTGVEVTARAVEQGVNKAVAQSYYSGWKKERMVVKPDLVPPVTPPVIPPTTIRLPSRKGVTPGTSTAGVFDVADEIYLRTGKMPSRSEVLAITRTKGMSDNVVDSYMVRWRKALKDIDNSGVDLVQPPGGLVPVAPVKPVKPVGLSVPTKDEQWKTLSDKLKGAINAATDPDGTITRQIAAKEVEIQALKKYADDNYELWKKWRNPRGGWMDTTPQELIEDYVKYSVKYNNLYGEVRVLQQSISGTSATDRAMLDILKRPENQRAILKMNTGKSMNNNLVWAKQTIEEMVHPDLVKGVQTVSVKVDKSGRAYYLSHSNSIHVSASTPKSTLVHELMHAVECRNLEVLKKSRQFLLKRANGEKAKQLSRLTGGRYAPHEVAFEDQWVKLGGDHYSGKDYNTAATEILSMGIERLLKSPKKFFDTDPEYFEFVVRTINDL